MDARATKKEKKQMQSIIIVLLASAQEGIGYKEGSDAIVLDALYSYITGLSILICESQCTTWESF